MDLKVAAEKLLEIADTIDKQAADLSYFVCSSCNHTVSLSKINERRMKAASENGVNKISPVTVDDKISCAVPGCDGVLSYVPTEESERFYVEAADESGSEYDDSFGEDTEDTSDDLFKAVDEQEEEYKKSKSPKKEEPEDTEDTDEDESEEDETKEDSEDDIDYDGMPDEEPEEKPKKKAPKKKADKPDDEKAAVPKERKPKFEKMPKEAEDEAFMRSVSKYASWS